jgi:hypothetical protein
MSERLQDLHRQRALLQEHLAWLDREISRETGAMPAVTAVVPPAAPSTPTPAPAPILPTSDPATELISRYNQESPGDMAKNAKRGCMISFVFAMVALALLALGTFAIYVKTH